MMRKHITVNVLSQAWTVGLSICLVPLYIHLLGIGAYGLIGFFTSLKLILAVMDLGLGTTANRGVQLRIGRPHLRSEIGDFVRTLEYLYALGGAIIAIVIALCANLIVRHFIHSDSIQPEVAFFSVFVFGVTTGVHWPVTLYASVLTGLEHHSLRSAFSAVIATTQAVGAVVLLWAVSPTIEAFLSWQLFVTIAEVVLLRSLTWRALAPFREAQARFSGAVIRQVWKFSLTVAAISLFAALLKQLDKVVLSAQLPMEVVGYYTTAATASSALNLIAAPFLTVAFPRFNSLIAKGDVAGLAATYHKLARLMSYLTAPLACLLVFFARDLLLLWTQSDSVAAAAGPVLSILGLAALLNAVMHLPHQVLLAAGLAWIPLLNNGLSLLFYVPLTIFLVSHYGLAGAGIAWVVFNVFYFLVIPQVLHRYVMRGEKARWIFSDTVPFMLVGLGAFGLARWTQYFVPETWSAVVPIALGFLAYGGVASLFYRPWALLKAASLPRRLIQPQDM